MGVFKPSAPKPPDPVETARAQTATNIGTAVANAALNNVNQITPYGELKYKQTGMSEFVDPVSGETYEIPTYTAKQKLSPHGRKLQRRSNATELNLADMAAQQSGMLVDHLGNPVDVSDAPEAGDASMLTAGLPAAGDPRSIMAGLPDLIDPASLSTGAETRDRVEAALMERLNSQMDGDREALRSRLANQGLSEGSEAYDRAMRGFGRDLNDARLSAILGAGQEASREFGMDLSRAGYAADARGQRFGENLAVFGAENEARDRQFGENLSGFNAANSARERDLNERFALRNQPLNEISALLSGSQVTSPSFASTPVNRIPTTDVAGIYSQDYQNRLGAYNARLGTSDSILGGLFGVAAAGVGAG